MATKTYTFDSTTEGWSWTNVSNTASRAQAANSRIETDGQIGRNTQGVGYWSISSTFASVFGINTTDTVSAVTNAAFNGTVVSLVPNGGSKTSTAYFGDEAPGTGTYSLLLIVNSTNNHTLIGVSSGLTSIGSTYNPNGDPSISGLSYVGSDSIELRLYFHYDNGNDANGETGISWDNVSITITSAAGPTAKNFSFVGTVCGNAAASSAEQSVTFLD